MRKSILVGVVVRALVIFTSFCASANLKLAQSVEDNLHKIETGMEFTYLFDYSASKKDADYTQLIFTDPLPDTVEFIRAEGTTHTYTPVYDAATHTVRIGFKKPFTAGSAGQLAITVRFPFGTADKTKAGNQAELSDGPANETMKSDTVNVFAISGAQMGMWFSRQNSATPVDQPVTYRVAARLGNTSGYGCDILRQVALTATFPANTVFAGASGSYTYDETTRTITWADAGDLIPGSVDTIYRDVTVRYPSSAFSVGGKVTIAAATQSVPDSGGDAIRLSATRTETLVATASKTEFVKQAVGRSEFVYVGKDGTILYNFPRILNAGNTTLEGLTLEDTIPPQFFVTDIYIGTYDNVPATSDSRVSIYYKTTVNDTWRLVSGSPFATNPASGSVKVGTTADNAVVLAADESITSLKWDFGNLDAPGRMGNVKIFGTVRTTDRNGAALVAGQMITNTALFSWTDANGAQSETVQVSSPVKTARPVGRLLSALIPDPSAGVTATVFPANANATISFSLENLTYAADALRAPVWGILLPVGVQPAGTPTIGTASASVGTVVPDHLAIYDYHNTGRVLIRFATTNSFPIYSSLEMRIPVFQPAGTTGGSKTADLYLLSYANDVVDGFLIPAVADTADFNGNGRTDDIMLVSSLSWTVPEQIAVDGTLEVRGALNGTNEWIKGTGATVAGGAVDYRLTIRNSGNTTVKDIHILDLLPSLGDTGVIDLTPRQSAWQPILAGPVSAPAGVTVLYSTAANPKREDFTTEPENTTEPEWSALPPATITKARALRFAFEDQGLLPGQSLTFSWPMRAPVDAPEGAVAWNSFGYYVTIEGHASPTSAAEPQSAGVRIDSDPLMSIGSQIWLDANKDGIRQDGEPGINGIRATLHSVSGSTTNEVAWTVTGPRNAGDGNDGYYAFPNLPAGTYCVSFAIPEDYTGQTAPADWTTFDGGIRSAPVVLTDGNGIDDVDLGLVLEGYSVSLIKTAGTADNDEVFWATAGDQVLFTYAVTNTGSFALTGFRISDPSLSGQLPSFPASLAPGAGFTTTATAAVSTPQNNTATVSANPASASDGREIPGSPAAAASDNAIIQIKSVISGSAWVDSNLDGVRQLRETAPTNTVTAKLFRNAALVATVETDEDGNYTFGSHTPGAYEIAFEISGYSVSRQVLQIAGANRANASGRTPAFTVSAEGTVDPQNIGLAPVSIQSNLPSSVEGRVWIDNNGNGIQDANEQGLSGVPVILFNSATQVVAQCRTERSGQYLFTNIVSEQEYSLKFDPEGTWTSVVKHATSDFTRDSDVNPETRTTDAFPLGSDLTLSNMDAGFRGGLPPGFWSDMNFINSFNAVILGNLVASGGDTEGRLLVGRDFNSGLIGYSIGFGPNGGSGVVPDLGTETDVLVVGGSFFDASDFGINGNVVYGRDHIGVPRLWFNHAFRKIPTADIRIGINGNVATDGSGMTFGEIREFIESSSAILGALPDRGATLVEKTEWNDLTLLGSDPELNVFNVTSDFWSFTRGQVTVDAPLTSTIVINVLGETVDISNGTFNITNVPWSQVIVNYVTATNISLRGVDHNGTVLAPAANLFLSGAAVNGTVLVGGNAAQNNGGEFHAYPFCGSFRLADSSDYSALRLTMTVNGSASGVIRQVAHGSDAVISYRVENLGNLAVTNALIVDSVAGTTNLIDYILPGQTLAARNSLRNLTVSTNYTASVSGTVREYGEERSVSSSAFVRIEVAGTSSDSDEQEVDSEDSTTSSGNVSVTDHVSIDRADLAVGDLQFLLEPTLTGQVFTVSATISNTGGLDAENFEVMFYLDANGHVQTGTSGDCAPIRISKLAAGDSIEVVQTLVSPAEKGWYKLRAFADWQGAVKEWSEGDNQLTLSYYTVPASLNIEIQADGSVLLSWNCFWGQSYSILYSTDLKNFSELATGIQPDFSAAPYGAKESVNYYLIAEPPATPAFFRLRVDQY